MWPLDLTFVYPRGAIDARDWHSSIFAGACLTSLSILMVSARRRRGPLATGLVFVGNLFPVLGFLDVNWFRFSYAADHLQYLPVLCLSAAAAIAVTRFASSLSSEKRTTLWSLTTAAVALLALGTWNDSRAYADAGTLYRTTLARNPQCWMAHNNLGELLSREPGHREAALEHFQAALNLHADYPDALFNLANALSDNPATRDEAIAEFSEALRLSPDSAEAHNNFGTVLAEIPSRVPEAISHYREALRLKPRYVEASFNLATVLSTDPSHRNEAIDLLESALRLRPDLVPARNLLQQLLQPSPAEPKNP